ncbi:MAG: hypothetical protein AAGI49_14590 [Bacteroidota bacterium]
MNFLLRHIEQNVGENDLVLGEQLFERNAVLNLQMVEKKLWIAKVNAFEVELKISPTKLEAATCECENYAANGMCEHIVASVLQLRRKLDQLKKEKPIKKSNKPSNRLTTKKILSEISEAALKRFVQEYASKDRNFALALKARFVGQVEISDDKNKYLQILDDAIKQARKKDRNISHRGKQKLLKITNELAQQLSLAIAQQHYRSAVFIAQSFIEKLTPILRKLSDAKEIVDYIKKGFQTLQQLIDLPIPPSLIEELWQYSITEYTKITYRINEIIPHFYRLQRVLAAKLNHQEALLDLLQEFSLQMQYSDENYTRLLISRFTLLEQLERWEESDQLVKAHLNHPNLLLFVIRQAMSRKDYAQAKYLGEKGLDNPNAGKTKAALEDILLQIAQQEGEAAKVVSYATARLYSSYEMKYFELLKTYFAGDWDKEVNKVLDKLQRTSFSLAQRDLIAGIFAEEEKFDDLLTYIEKLQSLDILQTFDQLLLQHRKSAVYELYEDLLSSYVKHHVGRKPAIRIRTKLQHLKTIGARQFVSSFVENLRSEYPERHALIEELEVF